MRSCFFSRPAAAGWVEHGPPWEGSLCPAVKEVASTHTGSLSQEADDGGHQAKKDAENGARNKSKDDALQEEGFARFWSGVCLKEREVRVRTKR